VRQALQLTRAPDHTTRHRTFAVLSQAQGQHLNDAPWQHLQVNKMAWTPQAFAATQQVRAIRSAE
jgi:hypothetical protein